MPRQIVDPNGDVISEGPDDFDDGWGDDEPDDCDCVDYDEDILTGRCICNCCGRFWYRIDNTAITDDPGM